MKNGKKKNQTSNCNPWELSNIFHVDFIIEFGKHVCFVILRYSQNIHHQEITEQN